MLHVHVPRKNINVIYFRPNILLWSHLCQELDHNITITMSIHHLPFELCGILFFCVLSCHPLIHERSILSMSLTFFLCLSFCSTLSLANNIYRLLVGFSSSISRVIFFCCQSPCNQPTNQHYSHYHQ